MPSLISLGTPSVNVTIRRSTRARRLTLRVSQINLEAILTVPMRAKQSLIEAFLHRQESWLRAQIEKAPPRVFLAFGVSVPVEGEMLKLVERDRGPVARGPGVLGVPAFSGPIGPKLRAYLKTLARERLALAAGHYADILDRSVSRLTLRDTRSRWGSCTSAGNLMFSWRLVMAPRFVLDYVAAHEACHLVHMDHSPEFWDAVRKIYGRFEAPRKWLRREGAGLHRYDFDNVT